jgi:hypothetical protein
LVGNACIRLVQFLTAPNVLTDLHGLEGVHTKRLLPRRLYAFALQEGGLDVLLDALVVRPFVAIARLGQRLDQRLSGERDVEPPMRPRQETRP